MNEKRSAIVFRVWLGIILVVLALPVVSMIALSFNESRFGTLPFEFSLGWYDALWQDRALLGSLSASIRLATDVTVIATIIGTLLAFGLSRTPLFVKGPVNGLILAVLTVPALILSTGLVWVFGVLGLGQSSASLLLASVVTSLPFVVLIVGGRVGALNPDLPEAARTLGAGTLRIFFRVTVPQVAPAIVAGAMLAFIICFNNFAIQLFLSPVGTSTLPVQIYSMVRLGVTPTVNALGTLIVAGTVLLILVLQWVTGNASRLFTTTRRA